MTSLSIQFCNDKPFLHIMIVPGKITYKEFIGRLNIKTLWRYLIIGLTIDKKHIFISQDMEDIKDEIVPSHLKVTIYKTDIQPMTFYDKIYYMIHEIDQKTRNSENVDYIVTWFNYNVNDINNEPILIYMIHKENGNWKHLKKTSTSFDEVEEAMVSKIYFSTIKEAVERFYELKEEYKNLI